MILQEFSKIIVQMIPQRCNCDPAIGFTSLDAVAHQLGHTPGSSMTRSYAKFLASAQQKIAGRSQRVMDEMLK